MKALSVRQPWASLIASGRKTLEVRSWSTSHRGELLIVASKAADRAAFARHGAGGPRGVAICIVGVVGCRPGRRTDRGAARSDAAGSWVFELANPRPVRPIEISGKLKLFDVDRRKVRRVRRRP